MYMVLIVLIYLNFHVKYLLDENIYTIEKYSDKKIVPSTSTPAMSTLKGNQQFGWKRTLQTFFYVYKPKYDFHIFNNTSKFV